MMKNKKGTIILSIILAVQFIIPLCVWGVETRKIKEFEEKGQEVKLLLNWAVYDEDQVELSIKSLENCIYVRDDMFIVFEEDENGFSTPKEISAFPETDIYITDNKLGSWYNEDWCFRYESEVTKAQNEYDYFALYDRALEKANIKNNFSEGPETQAYVVFKVYKNRFKVVNVYIDGMPVDTVIEKYNNNEWDNSRYDEQYTDSLDYDIYYDEEINDYITEYYDEELDEYVTEPVAA